MKYSKLYENWNKTYLKSLQEQEELLTEFNNKDKEIILNEGDSFTIAFEIELECEEDVYMSSRKVDLDFVRIEALLKEHLPRFYAKYRNILEVERDVSLENGFEMKVNEKYVYLSGINAAFEFLDTFFKDFDDQDMFSFHSTTGLHTNIGYVNKETGKQIDETFSMMKALFATNHEYALSAFMDRGGYAEDIKPRVKEIFSDEITTQRIKNNLHKKEVESTLMDVVSYYDEVLKKTISTEYDRNVGFNIEKLKDYKYIEFRYPGGAEIEKDELKEKVLYYCYIVKQGVDKEFKQADFFSKFIAFNQKLLEKDKTNTTKLELYKFVKDIPENEVFLSARFRKSSERKNEVSEVIKTLVESETIESFPIEIRKKVELIEKRYWEGRFNLYGIYFLYRGFEKQNNSYIMKFTAPYVVYPAYAHYKSGKVDVMEKRVDASEFLKLREKGFFAIEEDEGKKSFIQELFLAIKNANK